MSACPALPSVAGIDASFAAGFPPIGAGTPARIVAGDTVAQQLWTTIQANSTYAAALAINPQRGSATAANTAGYNARDDPACWWSAAQCTTPKASYLPPDFSVTQHPRVWGLTVDDGPYPSHCHLYDHFATNNIAADLYYIGGNVINNAQGAIDAFRAGHIICGHSWTHGYTTTMTNEQVFAELYYTSLAIKRVLGVTTRCFRPPYGDIDDRVRTIAHALGMSVWLWSHDTDDWQVGANGVAAVDRNFATIVADASAPNGTIVLTHETSEAITQRFIANYPSIRSAYTNGVLSAHVANDITRPYAETNYTYPNYAAYQGGQRASYAAVTNRNAQLTLISADAPLRDVTVSSSSAPVASSTVAAGASSSASAAAASAAAASSAPTTTGLTPTARNAIIGGAAGGAALLLALFVIWRLCRRNKPKGGRRQSVVAQRLAQRDISSPKPEFQEKHPLSHLATRPLPPGAAPAQGAICASRSPSCARADFASTWPPITR